MNGLWKNGLPVDKFYSVQKLKMSDEELAAVAEETTIFAKLSPDQRARIIHLLKVKVIRLAIGDGIGWCSIAQKCPMLEFSVDSAVDIAKEANVVLLGSLLVLEKGLMKGL